MTTRKFLVLSLILTFAYWGCSKLDENLGVAPVTSVVHETGTSDSALAVKIVHEKYFSPAQTTWDLKQCKKCHGADYSGGTTGFSCRKCHDVAYLHDGKLLDTASVSFHSKLIFSPAWNTTSCRKCHGSDFAGGKVGVSCKGCHDATVLHDSGIDSVASPNFHGKLILNPNWNGAKCQSCHGSDWAGGKVQKSCKTCHDASYLHDNGILNSSSNNFHGKLVLGSTWKGAVCQKCHGTDYSGGKVQKTCKTCHDASYLHDGGILTSASPNFHGKLALGTTWNGATCQKCHGADYSGGKVNKTCRTCHDASFIHDGGILNASSANFHGKLILNPTWKADDCKKCHGSDFAGGKVQKSCKTCHDATILHDAGIMNPSSANFHGNLILNPSWKGDVCQDCHGSDFAGGKVQKSCRTCHDAVYLHDNGIMNPSSATFHGKLISNNNWSMTKCQSCHGTTYSGGKVNKSCLTCHTAVGGPEACNTCHGSKTDPTRFAPPRALNGDVLPSSRFVGAHERHLYAPVNAKKTACAECHTVPAALNAAGHLDATAGAELVFGPMAKQRTNVSGTTHYDPALATVQPNPVYNSSNGSCANTYCHGTFKHGRQTNSVSWTSTTLKCGSCHGDGNDNPLPTTGAVHQSGLAANCQYCHSDVISNVSAGTYTWADRSKHVNGKLNVGGTEVDF